ncbi:MAG TPA: hypothetical protein VFE36_04410 [Candidatus Baltobacteraceae bacterium]|nr:hypothetical protein [Candidatus Baltobacteraceae bacterium]
MVAAAGDRRRGVTRGAIAIAIPAAFLFAAAIVRMLRLAAPETILTDLTQPLAVVTNWGAYGRAIFGVLFAMLAVATIVYFHVIRNLWDDDDRYTLRAGSIALLAALAAVCAWLIPFTFSSDVYAYAAYGELARLGANPYGHAPLPASDPVFSAATWQWGNPIPVCVYGPLFVVIAQLVVTALGAFGTTMQLDGLRVVAVVSLLACVPLAFATFPGTPLARSLAAFTIGLNPVAIWCAVEGHNDAIALAVVLAGIALARNGQPFAGAVVAALAGTIKLTGILGAVAGATFGPRARAGALLGAIATLALLIPLLHAVTTELAPQGRFAPEASLEALVKPLIFTVVHGDAMATVLTTLVAAIAALACVMRGVARLRDARVEGWIYFALGAWLLIPNPYPWYSLWLLPLAAAAPNTRPAAVAIWLSLFSVLRYVPDAVGAPAPPAAAILGAIATLPFLALLLAE